MMRRIILRAILFLFFLQLLTEFVAAIYAFGLLGTSIPLEIASVLLFFSPLLLLFWRRPLPLRLLLGLMLLSRVVLPFLTTRGRMLVAGVGVALFLLWLPAWLARQARAEEKSMAVMTGLALLLATSTAALLRAIGAGIDATTAGNLDALAWILAAVAVLLVIRFEMAGGQEAVSTSAGSGLWVVVALVGGIVGILTLVYFALAAPHVMARWAAVPLSFVLGILTLSTPAWALLFVSPLRERLTPPMLAGLTLLLTLSLALTLRGQQIAFPETAGAYPLDPTSAPEWQPLTLALTLALAPVLYLDFGLLLESVAARAPERRTLAAAFGVGALFLLLLIFAQVFTTVYDYIPLVGPWFRDRFWLVVAFPGLVVGLSLLVARHAEHGSVPAPAWLLPLLAFLLSGGGLVAVAAQAARPVETSPPSALRVLTYNIQQGYNAAGERAYQEQLEVLQAVSPDVIGLQESDTARIATGNDDLVAYLAGALDYYAYYGPSPVAGTFGIALLSRYPLLEPRTFYMYSLGEQTATIAASVETEAGRCRLLVTHLGNSGPLVQLQAILAALDPDEEVVLMGDFNFRPGSAQYKLATTMLVDAWAESGGQAAAPTFDPVRRIDHIFVSPSVEIGEVSYLPAPASDHPPLVAAVRCPGKG